MIGYHGPEIAARNDGRLQGYDGRIRPLVNGSPHGATLEAVRPSNIPAASRCGRCTNSTSGDGARQASPRSSPRSDASARVSELGYATHDCRFQELRRMSIYAWIILAVGVLLILWAITSYNRLIAMRQQCNQAFADVDVQLRQRHDLVPNLVESVRNYASHERGTLDVVVQARNAAAAAQGPMAKAQAESVLSSALRQLFALAETYPDLKANGNFQHLQTDLTGIENKLAAARRSFNNMVQGYNSMIQQFPIMLFAHAFSFVPHEFFQLGDDRQVADQAPNIKF